MNNDTAVLATFTSRHMGEVAKGHLEEAGVPAALLSDDAGGMEPPLTFIRPARLIVANQHMSQARDVLTRVYGRSLEQAGSPSPA